MVFIGAWQLELRKLNDDPMELDELILHVEKLGSVPEEKLTRELNNRFSERTEIRPNRIVYHDLEEMRHLLGVGTQLKEQKVLDRRPKKLSQETTGSGNSSNHGLSAQPTSNSLAVNPSNNVEVKS